MDLGFILLYSKLVYRNSLYKMGEKMNFKNKLIHISLMSQMTLGFFAPSHAMEEETGGGDRSIVPYGSAPSEKERSEPQKDLEKILRTLSPDERKRIPKELREGFVPDESWVI
jgi:hypothetical protein